MAEKLPEGTDTIVEDAGVTDEPEDRDIGPEKAGGAFFDRIEQFRTQGYDKAREYAVTGKDKATSALDDLLATINDAAGQIDGKIGAQYGDYARKAAESLGGFNDALKGKDVDELFADARALIARAPAVAVGTAAVLGFVIARLAKAGIDEAKGDKPSAEA
jgi:ElaB/YqjD/DUF883 family membrane-anchored ribosome-binding protein